MGSYFEEPKIYFVLFNIFGYYTIPFMSSLLFYNVENSKNKEKPLNE